MALFYWPGDALFNRFASAPSYPVLIGQAEKSGDKLADYIRLHSNRTRPLRINFVGHSLGCRVVLQALSKLDGLTGVRIDRVLLMAAAVPEGDCLPMIAMRPFPSQVAVEYEEVLFSTKDPNTALMTLAGTDQYWIDLKVPVVDLKWIRIPRGNQRDGSKVRIFDRDAWGQNVWREGRVIRLLAGLEAQGRMARLLVAVDEPALLGDEDAAVRVAIECDATRVTGQHPPGSLDQVVSGVWPRRRRIVLHHDRTSLHRLDQRCIHVSADVVHLVARMITGKLALGV